MDFTATTKTDHAMTERALGTSTESITGNKSKGKMLLHSFRKKTASKYFIINAVFVDN